MKVITLSNSNSTSTWRKSYAVISEDAYMYTLLTDNFKYHGGHRHMIKAARLITDVQDIDVPLADEYADVMATYSQLNDAIANGVYAEDTMANVIYHDGYTDTVVSSFDIVSMSQAELDALRLQRRLALLHLEQLRNRIIDWVNANVS